MAGEDAAFAHSPLGIPETDSQKPRRGRPALLPPQIVQSLQEMEPELTTRRSVLNRHYYFRALNVLDEADPTHGRYGWLLGTGVPRSTDSRRGRTRMVLLTELGRIDDPCKLCLVADVLCRDRPPTPQAVAAIRRLRGVRKKRRSCGLMRELVAVIDAYRQRYPDVSWGELAHAASHLHDMLLDLQGVHEVLPTEPTEQHALPRPPGP